MRIAIIPKYLYDAWVETGDCIDFKKEILVSEEDRTKIALEEMKEIWPEDECNEEEAEEYIYDNIENFPITMEELEENAGVSYFSYTSKSGDEIVIINYSYNW